MSIRSRQGFTRSISMQPYPLDRSKDCFIGLHSNKLINLICTSNKQSPGNIYTSKTPSTSIPAIQLPFTPESKSLPHLLDKTLISSTALFNSGQNSAFTQSQKMLLLNSTNLLYYCRSIFASIKCIILEITLLILIMK